MVALGAHSGNKHHEPTHERRDADSAEPTTPGEHLVGYEQCGATDGRRPADDVEGVPWSRQRGRLWRDETISCAILVEQIVVEGIVAWAG